MSLHQEVPLCLYLQILLHHYQYTDEHNGKKNKQDIQMVCFGQNLETNMVVNCNNNTNNYKNNNNNYNKK